MNTRSTQQDRAPRHPDDGTGSERHRITQDLLEQSRRARPARRRAIENEVIALNLPVARQIAGRYRGKHVNDDDLMQVAYLGLTKAVRGFDPDLGHDLLSYAVPTITGEIRRHFRDAGWVVRPTRRLQELRSRVWDCDARLTQQLQRSPSEKEIAEDLGVEADDVGEALSVTGGHTAWSLDAEVGEDGYRLMDRLGEPDEGFDRCEARVVLRPVIATLDDRDKDILRMRFTEGLTQEEIGDRIGVTQMQVSRLLRRILHDLRRALEGDPAAAA